MTYRFLGLGCSLVAVSVALSACSADLVVSPIVSDAGAGGSGAGGSTSGAGGYSGVSAGGASNTGGAIHRDAGADGATSDASTTDARSTGGADGGTGGTSAGGAGSGGATNAGNDAGPSCSTPVDFSAAPVLQANQIDTVPPAATGGAIADGLYYSTARIRYTGPGGATGLTGNTEQRAIIVSHGGTVFVDSQAAPGTTQSGTFTILLSDAAPTNQLLEAIVCPITVDPFAVSYTATPTTLTIFNPGGNTHVFTKQ